MALKILLGSNFTLALVVLACHFATRDGRDGM
ncbi:hypothetical protein ACVWY3_002411 [Bradyrhizobium sp. USDA 4486]